MRFEIRASPKSLRGARRRAREERTYLGGGLEVRGTDVCEEGFEGTGALEKHREAGVRRPWPSGPTLGWSRGEPVRTEFRSGNPHLDRHRDSSCPRVVAPAQPPKYREDCGPRLGGQVQCRIDESDQWKESTIRNIVALGDGRDDDATVDEIAP